MNGNGRTLFTSILLLWLASPLSGQLHPGVPSADDEMLLSGVMGLTDHDGRYSGVRFAGTWTQGIAYFAAVGRTTFGDDDPSHHLIAGGLGADATPWLADFFPGLPPSLFLIPRAEVRLSKMGDLWVTAGCLSAAVGWGWGPEFGNWAVFPYLAPALMRRRASLDGHTSSGWYGGLEGGVALGVDRFIMALELARVWTPSREDRLQVSAGVLF